MTDLNIARLTFRRCTLTIVHLLLHLDSLFRQHPPNQLDIGAVEPIMVDADCVVQVVDLVEPSGGDKHGVAGFLERLKSFELNNYCRDNFQMNCMKTG